MATALTLDLSLVPPPLPSDGPSPAMATATESLVKPSSPRRIPNPVSIPSRFDDSTVLDSFHAVGSVSPQASPRLPHGPPPPIPDFVFPARPSTSAPSSYSRATGRRPKSVADLQEHHVLALGSGDSNTARSSRSPALPDFVFNPGASLPPTPAHAFLSPPQSPQSPRAIPARPSGAGHRRGGSEFVGGSLRSGEAFTLMSTSPTKSESGLASPTFPPANSQPSGPSGAKPSGPPAGRRGHAHRRSAAISSHDLSVLLQPTSPTPPARGSSAPSSPSGFDQSEKSAYNFPEVNTADGETTNPGPKVELSSVVDTVDVPQAAAEPTPAPVEEHQALPLASKPLGRARVGFSDTLEFIPRPLSLVSSDTSSTVTARPTTGGGSGGHSVSGSISSIASLNASIAAGVDRETVSPLVRSPSRSTAAESRPSTAGAVLDRTQSITANDNDGVSPRRRNSIPLASLPAATSESIPETAPALPSPSRTPKRWSFFSLDPFIGNSNHNSPTRASPSSSGSGQETAPAASEMPIGLAEQLPNPASDRGGAIFDDIHDDSNLSSASKTVGRKLSNKKKKKVKSWGILTRKSKPRRKSRRAPTPPPAHRQDDSDDESVETVPQPSNAVGELGEVIAAPPQVLVSPSGPSVESPDASPSWQAPPSPSLTVPPNDDASFPMIDLDAALGPFNTPLPRNPEWEAAQRAGGLAKRQLHSAAGMTRFTGPGMHYSHRRAESAPEMPPFNRAGIPRYSSSTAMADVFEEDEEEDDTKENGAQQQVNDKENNSKPASVYSVSSSASTPPRRPTEFPDRPPSIDIRITSSDGHDDASFDRPADFSAAASDDATSSIALSRRGSGLSGISDDDKTQPSTCLKSEYSASSLHDDVIVEEEANGFAFGDNDCEFVVESSSDSTIHSPGRLLKGKDLAPVDVSPLHLPTTSSLAPVSPYSMGPSSAFPSPRSPMSYDANRISTAPSSVTEDNFQSLLLGEPGPEVRISSDIPSLTSSNSTMTRESANAQAPQYPHGTQPRPYLASRGTDRPASFTSTAFGRRRSSLASLHRLISTSHGERSKLSMEVQLDTDNASNGGGADKRASKVSRTKRLSRMMQFWKAKDDTTP